MLLSRTRNQDLYLESGPLSLPFQITLPIQLPCSLMDKIGKILYTINATVDIPWYTVHIVYNYVAVFSIYCLLFVLFKIGYLF